MAAPIQSPERSWKPLFRIAEKQTVSEVFEEALEARNRAPKSDREAMDGFVRPIRVSGFRPGRGPADKLAPRLAKICFHEQQARDTVLPTVLRIWLSNKPEFRERVEAGLRSLGIAINVANSGWIEDWPAKEFDRTVEELQTESSDDEDSLRIAICYLTGRAPAIDSDKRMNDTPGVHFEAWLGALRALDADSAEWDQFEGFIEQARSIADTARRHRDAIPVFAELHRRAQEIRDIFKVDVAGWCADAAAESGLAEAVELINEVMRDVDVLCRPIPAPYEEKLAALDGQRGATERALESLKRLETFFGQDDRILEYPRPLPCPGESDAADAPAPEPVSPEDAKRSEAASEAVSVTEDGPEMESAGVSAAVQQTAANGGIALSNSADRESNPALPVVADAAERAASISVRTLAEPPAVDNESGGPDAPHRGVAEDERVEASNVVSTTPEPAQGPDPIAIQPMSEPAVVCGGDTAAGSLEAPHALPIDPPAIAAHVWKLVGDRRFGLATAVSRALGRTTAGVDAGVPDWLLEALALGGNIASDSGESAIRLAATFAQFDPRIVPGRHNGASLPLRLLLFAATPYPALMAPRTGATSVLHSIGVPELHDICQAIAEFSSRLQPLDSSVLADLKSEAVRRSALEKVQSAAADWLLQSAGCKLCYAPATWVLRKWIEVGQPLHDLLQPVRDHAVSRVPVVERKLNELASSKQVRKLVEHTDRVVMKRRMGKPILGDALTHLEDSVRDAADIAKHWLGLQSSLRRSPGSYQIETVGRLRREIEQRYPAASDFLQTLTKHHANSEIGWAARCALATLHSLNALFEANTPFVVQEVDPDLLLHGELLTVPGLTCGEDWAVEPDDPSRQLDALSKFLLNPTPAYRDSMRRLCEAGDHLATARLLSYIRVMDTAADVTALERQREDSLREERNALDRRLKHVRRRIDNAVALSHLTEAERLAFTGVVEEVQLHLAESVVLHRDKRRLDEIEATITANRDKEVESVRQRLQQIAPDHPERERILGLLNAGDVVTANDYIESIRKGEPLPSHAHDRDPFQEFFPERMQKIEQSLADTGGLGMVVRKVQAGKNFCDIDMSRVVGAQGKQAAEMLDVWQTVKRQQDIDEKAGRYLLDCLGYNVLSIRINRKGRRVWMDVVTDPVADRERCPIPFFGSEACGNYRVLCFWARPTEEDLISDVGDTAHGKASLVFYFGRMSEARRRDLARQSVRQRRSFVLLDETLLVFLCGERGSRLPVLFSCALPFTWAEPYTTTAGLLAPEMLYGRQQERASVINPHGSCFIYGGRQLGKTVLLRDVERQVHDPASGRIALWVDLKAKGIGYDRSVDDLWPLLASELKVYGVLPPAANVHASPDKMFEHIEHWLATEHSRRILLLLDEADRFLEIDGSPRGNESGALAEFARAARIKGLMEKTKRRFKAVFAGLHNVQRTTQLENHPLAHYGDALCIGPLLHGSDRRAACELVEGPLRALGFVFESQDLVMRLVAQANYYPSLIQLYCSHLLQHVAARPQAGPPYVLTSRHLEELYDSRELQRAIRDRLQWTLQLDERYEVLANIIAWNYMWDRDKGIMDGISVSTIRQDAISVWPEEFQKIASERAFEVLLEEMVGLGVLRTATPGRYTLRSPNVLNLMGNLDEIEAALARKREPVAQFEATAFRAAKLSDPVVRSCFTAQQEAQLKSRSHSVLAVFGLPAGGLGDVRESVERLFGRNGVVNCSGVTDPASFARKLQELDKRAKDAHTLIFVPSVCPWTEAWLKEARQKIEKLTSKNSFVTVLFVGDGQTAWQWSASGLPLTQHLNRFGVRVLTLEAWKDSMVRQWLDDCQLPSGVAFREKLKKITGYWSELLYSMQERLRSCPGGVHGCEALVDELVENVEPVKPKLFGLGTNGPLIALRALATLDMPVTPEELSDVSGVRADEARRAFDWGDLMGVVCAGGGDRWQIDPVVGRVLRELVN